MTSLHLPRPALLGPGRRARWRRTVLRRVLAASCVAAAAVVGLREVRPPPPPTDDVVVAVRPVADGAVLRVGDVGVRPLPRAGAPPGGFARVADVVGRRVGSGLAAGEAVTTTRVVPRGPTEGLGSGLVALHVLLADPSAAELLFPGQRADVYPTAGGPALARSVRVLAVDPAADRSATSLDVGGSADRGVVLALSSDSAAAVLARHGALEGPPVVNVAVVPP